MKVFFTDLSKSNNMFSYLFDFKCNQIFSSEIKEHDILKIHMDADTFEKIITRKLDTPYFENIKKQSSNEANPNYICIVSTNEMWDGDYERYFICSIEDNRVDKVYLSEEQFHHIDELIEIEDKKDLSFFEKVVDNLNNHFCHKLDYQILKKVILKYASERNLDEDLSESLSTFMKYDEQIKEVMDSIHQIEELEYNTFDFQEVVDIYYQEEHVEEDNLSL